MDSLLRRIAHVPGAAMDTTAETASSGASHPAYMHAALPAVGELVDGRYRIEGVLGEGAMGVVFSAQNLRTGREVALKYTIPPRGRRDDEGARKARLARFIREAQAAGKVRHPHVVDIYDAGGDTAAPYLVMERLHGESMADRLRRGSIPWQEALRMLAEAARGVAAAHEQGVVHRDLKPENLFLEVRSESPEPRVKVLDFGVSRIIDPALDLHPITRSGAIIGTPAYMPLEQLRAEREVDARADVYALGAILYEVISSKRPYQASSLHDLVLRMATEPPTPITDHEPTVPAWLAGCIDKCLARDPSHRYVNARELVGALELRGAEEGTQGVAPPTRRYTRLFYAAAVLVLTAGTSLYVVGKGPWFDSPPAASKAAPDSTRASLLPAPPTTSRTIKGAGSEAALAPQVPVPEAQETVESAAGAASIGTRPSPPASRKERKERTPKGEDPTQRARDIRPEDF